jgi:hypothetical protein
MIFPSQTELYKYLYLLFEFEKYTSFGTLANDFLFELVSNLLLVYM